MKFRYYLIFQFLLSLQVFGQDSTYFLKVNIHFMLNEHGKGSFSEIGSFDVSSDSLVNGYAYAQRIIDVNNSKLSSNKPMNLVAVGSLPNVPSVNYRYVLTGVYFHRDSMNCYYSHHSPKILLNTYGVNNTNEINVFMTQWPLGMPEGKRKSGGVAGCLGCGNVAALALVDPFVDYKKYGCHGWLGPTFGTILNHEMGHLLGLMHNWDVDNCDDTPEHKRAWCGHDPEQGVYVDNNMMSYNCGQNAITNCQLEIINRNIKSNHLQRSVLSLEIPPIALFTLEDVYKKNDSKMIDGSWRYDSNKNEDGYRLIVKKVSNQKGRKLRQSKIYTSKWINGQYYKIDIEKALRKKLKRGGYDVTLEVRAADQLNDNRSKFMLVK